MRRQVLDAKSQQSIASAQTMLTVHRIAHTSDSTGGHLSDLDEGRTQVCQDVAQALCLLRRERLHRRRALHLARKEPPPECKADLPATHTISP